MTEAKIIVTRTNEKETIVSHILLKLYKYLYGLSLSQYVYCIVFLMYYESSLNKKHCVQMYYADYSNIIQIVYSFYYINFHTCILSLLFFSPKAKTVSKLEPVQTGKIPPPPQTLYRLHCILN